MKTRDKGGETVAITVRMVRPVWEAFRESCYRRSVSMNEAAVEAIVEDLKEAGIYHLGSMGSRTKEEGGR